MPETINNPAPAPTSRDWLRSQAAERFPDRNFAAPGADGSQEGADDLDDAIKEMIEGFNTQRSEYDENNQRLKDALLKDPDAPEFMENWIKYGSPQIAYNMMYGDGEGLEGDARTAYDERMSRKAAAAKINAEADANWQKSLEDMVAWGDERGLSFEQKRDIMVRLVGIAYNGMENRYGPEDFELALNGINHDNDVQTARTEGEVAGRNERIAAARRERGSAPSVPSSPAGGQGARMPIQRPRTEEASPWAGIR